MKRISFVGPAIFVLTLTTLPVRARAGTAGDIPGTVLIQWFEAIWGASSESTELRWGFGRESGELPVSLYGGSGTERRNEVGPIKLSDAGEGGSAVEASSGHSKGSDPGPIEGDA